MAYSLNRCEFIGNLGADPEGRAVGDSGYVVNLRIACTDRWKNREGEMQESTQWIPVTIWNEGLGKVAENYLRKGSKVYVSGRWETRKWEDKEGNERYSTECVLRNFGGELILLDSRSDDAGGGREARGSRDDRGRSGGRDDRGDRHRSAPPRGGSSGGGGRRNVAEELDDDIPFRLAVEGRFLDMMEAAHGVKPAVI